MTDLVIRVENLGKRYKIGRLQTRNDTLRDSIAYRVSQIAHRRSSNGDSPSADLTQSSVLSPHPSDDTLWALRDVSFEVKRGEVVGIIGRNGAGKSTLLKILSRITEPTTGAVDLYGRVGSLLEVGTGFHPELTGRENIFLNGAILGMRKVDIERRFDEIVAFAEVEKFIDTPVKRYSSGMYVRLAFAVAAHLEPEILVVDEVLAVGDAAFQKKSLGKMSDVAHEGRTVLFVSHNLGMIRGLCEHGLWLDGGRIAQQGAIVETVSAYQKSMTLALETGDTKVEGFTGWRILNSAYGPTVIGAQEALQIAFHLRLTQPLHSAYVGIALNTSDGRQVGGWGKYGVVLDAGEYELVYKLDTLPVRPGNYYWTGTIWDGARRVDISTLIPELTVVTEDFAVGSNSDGVLNLPFELTIRPGLIDGR